MTVITVNLKDDASDVNFTFSEEAAFGSEDNVTVTPQV